MNRELRSKFLHDLSTPERANLTTQLLTARMSGDNQTLKELRHKILARRTLKHPPPDAVPGLDVEPLREHAWLESLADAGVVTDASVFDRLARESVPSHPPFVVDLGSDSDSITSMETDATPSTFGRDQASRPNKIAIGESFWLVVPDDGQGQNDRLSEDEWPKRLAGSLLLAHGPGQLSSPAAFYQPYSKMEDVPSYDLSEAEQEAFDYFESEEAAVEGARPRRESLALGFLMPSTFLAMILCPLFFYAGLTQKVCNMTLGPTRSFGIFHFSFLASLLFADIIITLLNFFLGEVSLDLEELGLDEQLRPMSKTPEEPVFDYDTVHGLTGGPRGADRNAGRGAHTAGRTARRAERIQVWDPDRGEHIPSRSTVQVPINRGSAGNSALELITQYIEYQRVAKNAHVVIKGLEAVRDGALSQVTQLRADLKTEKTAKAEADKELAELRLKAKELEDVKTKNQDFELALKTARDEMTAILEDAKAEVGRTALADFKKSEEFIGLLGERYDGGWVAAKRCVCHSHPDF
ncbi:hypothetical protein BVRB_8g202200 [Beta vulgaris subsp. vulgaris]|uniref:Uncharacterized protein n=1 Tax=Beta vulgaris subsp. vulgaris TaxID=3555 RepID=A0A0J8B982_BETVV|nr:hypothetical protein BVRB_8g202200 [Beta vulgaris subsp. vulgaris]